MTTNVTVRVPPHVNRVLISYEKFDGEHWVPDGSLMVNADSEATFAIHDTRRVCSIAELQDDKAYAARVTTINEHAHGDDSHG
jgi:hypothetical protein